jgi:purine-cytosine permease-like protein
MATDPEAELRIDVHCIEPIPEADKDSTGLQQTWIWAGANIAPINWALGALGIVLKLVYIVNGALAQAFTLVPIQFRARR